MSQATARNFFCHQCNGRTRINADDFACSSCGSGFIEEVSEENGNLGSLLNDSDDESENGNDLFGNGIGENFIQTLFRNLTGSNGPMQAFQFRMGGGPSGSSNILHGNFGDYAWGSGGLDSIVTRLLNQMDDTGPPSMKKEDINSLATIKVTQKQIDEKAQCSVCWDDFKLDEVVNQLQCEHIFHKDCITPWLELHATCPVCRKPLNKAAEDHTRQSDQEGSSTDSNVTFSTSSSSQGNQNNSNNNSSDNASENLRQSTSGSSSFTLSDLTSNINASTSRGPTMPSMNEDIFSLNNPFSSILNQFFGDSLASQTSQRNGTTRIFTFPTNQNQPTRNNVNESHNTEHNNGNQNENSSVPEPVSINQTTVDNDLLSATIDRNNNEDIETNTQGSTPTSNSTTPHLAPNGLIDDMNLD